MDQTKIKLRQGNFWNFVRPLRVRFDAYRQTKVYFQYDLWEMEMEWIRGLISGDDDDE